MAKDTFISNSGLTFRDALGNAILTRLVEINLDTIENLVANCNLVCEVSFETYMYLESQAIFNNAVQGRLAGWQREFDKEQKIEMEIKLAPDLLMNLVKTANSAETITQLLLSIPIENQLLFSENWFLTCVKQAITLPPEFGNATLKEGYLTQWADSND